MYRVNWRIFKYNNPHKTSLYISCGLPVIIWKETAMASFTEKNKLGFSVNSLEEIDEKLANMTDDEYQTMKNNALQMAQKVRAGFFIKKEAIKIAESLLVEKKVATGNFIQETTKNTEAFKLEEKAQ